MYDEANTNYRFEEMVTKKYFVHHPSDLRVSLQSYHITL